jgi:HK97 family phage portal protein
LINQVGFLFSSCFLFARLHIRYLCIAMGIISQIRGIFQSEQRNSLSHPAEWMYTWMGGKPTRSGVNVNGETALTHAGVFACAKILSESVASLPVALYIDTGEVVNELSNDTRTRLIGAEPSELYTSFDFRSTAMLHLALHGNFYADIIRDGNRRPVELRIIENPNWVKPELDPEGRLWYRIFDQRSTAGGYVERTLPVRARDIIHVKGISSNGIEGKSPITLFRENVGLGIATTQTQGSLWKNGTLINGYLKHPGRLAPDQAQNLRDSWQSRYTGRDNAGKTPVLEAGMEFVPLTLKPADAMFIETAKLSLHDVCRIYRIPPHMVGDLERSTNNNIEHQSLEFVRDTLRPWLKNWEQELNRKLLFESEKNRMFFRFNVDALLRGDTKSRSEYFARALGSVSTPGWMTPNEVRRLENMNPVTAGDTVYNPTLNNEQPDVVQADNIQDNGQQQASATA